MQAEETLIRIQHFCFSGVKMDFFPLVQAMQMISLEPVKKMGGWGWFLGFCYDRLYDVHSANSKCRNTEHIALNTAP